MSMFNTGQSYLSYLAYINTPQSSHCHVLDKTTYKHSTLIEVERREEENVMRVIQHQQLDSQVCKLLHVPVVTGSAITAIITPL